jgi:hypothetical protein
MASSVASTIPASSPGRPACTAAMTPAAGSAKSTGTQSATSTTRARSVAVVTTASHSGGSAGHGPSTDLDVRTVALVHEHQPISRHPSSAASRARLIDTWSGSSPTWRARLSPSKGAEAHPTGSVGDGQLDAVATLVGEEHDPTLAAAVDTRPRAT